MLDFHVNEDVEEEQKKKQEDWPGIRLMEWHREYRRKQIEQIEKRSERKREMNDNIETTILCPDSPDCCGCINGERNEEGVIVFSCNECGQEVGRGIER